MGADYIAWYEEDSTKVYIGNSRRSMFNEDEVLAWDGTKWKLEVDGEFAQRACLYIQVKSR